VAGEEALLHFAKMPPPMERSKQITSSTKAVVWSTIGGAK
jgi:hypothetical protein